MIEINLLPEDLKVRRKQVSTESMRLKYLLCIILLFFMLSICIHAYLAVLSLTGNYQLRLLNTKWQRLAPQREILAEFKHRYETSSGDANMVEGLMLRRINWSEKLNKLSLALPSQIWFNELSLKQKDFILKGSAISLEKEELSAINKFIANLKSDAAFFKYFNNLELGSIQRRVIGGYDIVDFVLSGTLKSE